MIIIEADVLGYCMGVRRAVEIAEATARSTAEGTVHTIGPLIHNRHALDSLAALGVTVLDEGDLPGSLEGRTVVIRAHGISPVLKATLEGLGARLVDASCPRVLASQQRAKRASEAGRQVILVGDREHAEIIGIAGHAPGCSIVSSAAEARALEVRKGAVVIAQTTVKDDEYAEICDELRSKGFEIETVNSICGATTERQGALRELASRVDAIIVVGGRSSANARRLLATALESGKPAWLIEDETELPAGIERFERVGISAGASTPDDLVAAVKGRLGRF
jgi:4-hydroxy-3-methylbut-2-en-1-yl diphosphate reductase